MSVHDYTQDLIQIETTTGFPQVSPDRSRRIRTLEWKLHLNLASAPVAQVQRLACSRQFSSRWHVFFSFKRFSRVDYSAGATHSTVGRAATGARQTTTAAIRSSGRLLRPQKEGQVPITLDFMYIRVRDSCGLCIIIYTVKGRIIGTPDLLWFPVGPLWSFGTTASPIRPSAL